MTAERCSEGARQVVYKRCFPVPAQASSAATYFELRSQPLLQASFTAIITWYYCRGSRLVFLACLLSQFVRTALFFAFRSFCALHCLNRLSLLHLSDVSPESLNRLLLARYWIFFLAKLIEALFAKTAKLLRHQSIYHEELGARLTTTPYEDLTRRCLYCTH